jgi:predicted transcriptional regulator
MRQKEQTDFWNNLSESQQDEIQKGIKELDEGKKVSWQSVLKKLSN